MTECYKRIRLISFLTMLNVLLSLQSILAAASLYSYYFRTRNISTDKVFWPSEADFPIHYQITVFFLNSMILTIIPNLGLTITMLLLHKEDFSRIRMILITYVISILFFVYIVWIDQKDTFSWFVD